MTTNSFVVSGGQTIGLSSMFAVSGKAGSPSYLVLTGLDRNEYTAGASGATGTLLGNGHTDSFVGIGGDARGAGIVFTLQAASGRYYSSTYGYFDQLGYKASSMAGDVTNLSLFATNNLSLANSYANNPYAMEQLDASGYLGSATVVTQAGFGAVPSQATPNSIASNAMNFVGKAWNMDGCWVLASTIAAESGASLPVDSSMVGVSGQANGEWFVAFDGTKQTGNWQSMVKAGEMVVIGSASSGHITTVVSGAGGSAMLVDNITYLNSSGVVQNSAHDGSANDVLIAAPHLATQEWSGVQTSMVKIYELDTPVVTDLVASDKLALNGKQFLNTLFSAADPLNKAVTQYQVYNTATGDTLLVNGATVTAHSAATAATVSSLSLVALHAGAAAAADTLEVRAFNGSYWGDWQALSVAVGGTTTTAATTATTAAAAPAVSAPLLAQATPNQAWLDGQKVSLTLPANTFVDPQGQKLSYTAYQIGGNSVVGWLSFNAGTDTFSGTVPLNASGQVELEVVATNTSGLSTKDLFYVSLGTAVPTVTVAHGMAVSDSGAADMEISLVGRASPHYDFHHSIV